jgi:hypothetical protein
MSKKDYGGKIFLRKSSGEKFSLRGTLTIDPSTVSVESITNQDGSGDRVFTNRLPSAEISFADRGYNYDSLLLSARSNFTFEEDNTDVTFYFTQGFFTGSPSANRINGEVTGMKIEAEKITRRG